MCIIEDLLLSLLILLGGEIYSNTNFSHVTRCNMIPGPGVPAPFNSSTPFAAVPVRPGVIFYRMSGCHIMK